MTESQLDLYRRIASDLRGGELFEEAVRFVVASVHAASPVEKDAAVVEASDIVKMVLQIRAEDCGLALDERHLNDIAGAVLTEARSVFVTMPAEAGHA